MNNNNAQTLRQPDEPADDPLTSLLRQGARQLIAQAVEAELQVYLGQLNDYGGPRSTSERGLTYEHSHSGVSPGVRAGNDADKEAACSCSETPDLTISPPAARTLQALGSLKPLMQRFTQGTCAARPRNHSQAADAAVHTAAPDSLLCAVSQAAYAAVHDTYP